MSWMSGLEVINILRKSNVVEDSVFESIKN